MPKEENVTVNRKYKDSVFRLLFAESKENALSLYNAVNKTNYTNAEELVFVNLEDAFYINIKNDAAFVFSKNLTLYEHQSTMNKNMPLRGLFYFDAMYRGMVDVASLYSDKMIKIPTPQFVVFYNGRERTVEDVVKLKLSDMFEVPTKDGEFEWTATMININYGHNAELTECCKSLNGYAILIEKIRTYHDEYVEMMPYEEAQRQAVKRAVEECIGEGILKEFLMKHRKEVVELSMFEFSEEEYQKLYIDTGRSKERMDAIHRMIDRGFTEEQILMLYSEEEYEKANAEMLKPV